MLRFVQNLYDMTSDELNCFAVGFSQDGSAIELRDAELLSQTLPKYFKHNKVQSFVRQLNNYGFKRIEGTNCKVPPRNSRVTQSYAHPYFHRDKPEQLKNVKRPISTEDHRHPRRGSIGSSADETKPRSDSELERELEDATMLAKCLEEANHVLQRRNAELTRKHPSPHRNITKREKTTNFTRVERLDEMIASSQRHDSTASTPSTGTTTTTTSPYSASASTSFFFPTHELLLLGKEEEGEEEKHYSPRLQLTERRSSLEEIRVLLETRLGAPNSDNPPHPLPLDYHHYSFSSSPIPFLEDL